MRWASSTEGASLLHCVQPGAQNHKTTGRPDDPTSVVGSMSKSSPTDTGEEAAGSTTDPSESVEPAMSAESPPQAATIMATAATVVRNLAIDRITTSR